VRRLSVASLDSGAESPVYGEEPSALVDRGPVVNPPRADGDGRREGADGITLLQAPQCRATRDITMTVGLATPWQVGTRAARLATSCDMSVVDQQSARWYVKDIRASTQPMGSQ
jgi:hypothetical protein